MCLTSRTGRITRDLGNRGMRENEWETKLGFEKFIMFSPNPLRIINHLCIWNLHKSVSMWQSLFCPPTGLTYLCHMLSLLFREMLHSIEASKIVYEKRPGRIGFFKIQIISGYHFWAAPDILRKYLWRPSIETKLAFPTKPRLTVSLWLGSRKNFCSEKGRSEKNYHCSSTCMPPTQVNIHVNIVNLQEDEKTPDHSHPFCPNLEKYHVW